MFFRTWITKTAISNYAKANAVDLAASMTGDVLSAYIDPTQAYNWLANFWTQQPPLHSVPATPARYKA